MEVNDPDARGAVFAVFAVRWSFRDECFGFEQRLGCGPGLGFGFGCVSSPSFPWMPNHASRTSFATSKATFWVWNRNVSALLMLDRSNTSLRWCRPLHHTLTTLRI
jgi:hypothetical protein